MKVCLLLPLVLLCMVTLFGAANGDNMTDEYFEETHTVTPTPASMQKITTPHSDNYSKATPETPQNYTTIANSRPNTNLTTVLLRMVPIKPTYKLHNKHHTIVLHTIHTTQEHSPTEYFLIALPEYKVCLRIKAVIEILHLWRITNVTIPSPPNTKASGNCGVDTARLTLTFPRGELSLTFRMNKNELYFYLETIHIKLSDKDIGTLYCSIHLEALVSPVGHPFTCKEVNFKLDCVNFVLRDVEAQAFEMQDGNLKIDTEYISTFNGKYIFIKFDLNLICIPLFIQSFNSLPLHNFYRPGLKI
ncbi:uncharacterized protein [Pyxicephalus adspersus]|uniref:uncharacterized protein n=1 Tax=Pyxicephalus adspersus TaxID=30357 RepID=UPI003B59A6F3